MIEIGIESVHRDTDDQKRKKKSQTDWQLSKRLSISIGPQIVAQVIFWAIEALHANLSNLFG